MTGFASIFNVFTLNGTNSFYLDGMDASDINCVGHEWTVDRCARQWESAYGHETNDISTLKQK